MTTVRLMDAPADYARFGGSPDHVELWEDQPRRRQERRPSARMDQDHRP
jgi:hypothetical protein